MLPSEGRCRLRQFIHHVLALAGNEDVNQRHLVEDASDNPLPMKHGNTILFFLPIVPRYLFTADATWSFRGTLWPTRVGRGAEVDPEYGPALIRSTEVANIKIGTFTKGRAESYGNSHRHRISPSRNFESLLRVALRNRL